jgi:hypothetical protein
MKINMIFVNYDEKSDQLIFWKKIKKINIFKWQKSKKQV